MTDSIDSVNRTEFLLGEILLELRNLRADLRAQVAASTTPPRAVRAARRAWLIRQLAAATKLGETMGAAHEVLSILRGAREIPYGCGDIARALMEDPECPKSTRHLLRIIQAGAPGQDDTTDTAAGLCHWLLPR